MKENLFTIVDFSSCNNYGTIKCIEIYVEEFYPLLENIVQSAENQPTFRRICRLHLQGRIISQARNQLEAGSKQRAVRTLNPT
jgi:hypothetical protein